MAPASSFGGSEIAKEVKTKIWTLKTWLYVRFSCPWSRPFRMSALNLLQEVPVPLLCLIRSSLLLRTAHAPPRCAALPLHIYMSGFSGCLTRTPHVVSPSLQRRRLAHGRWILRSRLLCCAVRAYEQSHGRRRLAALARLFPCPVLFTSPKSKVNNRAKCFAISQIIRAKLYNKLSPICL